MKPSRTSVPDRDCPRKGSPATLQTPHWKREANGHWVLENMTRPVAFPVFDEVRESVAIQGPVIAPDEPGARVVTRGDVRNGAFRTDTAPLSDEPLVIVEAPIDALSLTAAGVRAIALYGTAVPGWLPTVAAFARIVPGFGRGYR